MGLLPLLPKTHNMEFLVVLCLSASGLALPLPEAEPSHVASGVPVGPLTPAFGDSVQTPKGLRSLALEGFSEDINQDGFVDPIGQAVIATPVVYAQPQVVAAPQVAVAAPKITVASTPIVSAGPAAYSYSAPVYSVGVPQVVAASPSAAPNAVAVTDAKVDGDAVAVEAAADAPVVGSVASPPSLVSYSAAPVVTALTAVQSLVPASTQQLVPSLVSSQAVGVPIVASPLLHYKHFVPLGSGLLSAPALTGVPAQAVAAPAQAVAVEEGPAVETA